jgi:hypothetical protein
VGNRFRGAVACAEPRRRERHGSRQAQCSSLARNCVMKIFVLCPATSPTELTMRGSNATLIAATPDGSGSLTLDGDRRRQWLDRDGAVRERSTLACRAER